MHLLSHVPIVMELYLVYDQSYVQPHLFDILFSNYFLYLNTVSKLASGTLSKDINIKNELPDAIKKAKDLIIIGDQSTVIDKLIEFIDIVGPFGTLLITGHDFGNSRKLWESSFTKMSESVEPILSKYLKQKFAA